MSSRWNLIAQITDLHIKRPGELAYEKVDTAAALTRCIDTLNALLPRPNLVVITGDLVDTPLLDEYEHLLRLLAPLELPLAVVPGNHVSCHLVIAFIVDQVEVLVLGVGANGISD